VCVYVFDFGLGNEETLDAGTSLRTEFNGDAHLDFTQNLRANVMCMMF
jgi:hypothetical protein